MKDELAFPNITLSQAGGAELIGGLTKRELFAMEAHAQLTRFVKRGEMTSEIAAGMAVKHADALLAELAKPKETKHE